jgi:NAD(P)-dependent dehydrogenase (short-subunit alcohol dehydrogenase family)
VRLEGKRVLLTGASRGIGAALLGALEEKGCDVCAVARTPSKRVRRVDVSDPAQVRALRDEIGAVDVLVNNAGVIHAPAPLTEIPLEEWERLFGVNVFGMVAVLQAFVPAMEERESGYAINLSSTWGRSAAAQQSPYCATKFAVEALSQALAQEVAPGVCVVAVNPGVVATDMLATCFGGDVSSYTPPAECAASLVRMMERMDPSWNGRSLTAPEF